MDFFRLVIRAPLCVLLFSVGALAQTPGNSTPITFGVILSLTGPTAIWGTMAQRGIALAVDEINSSGGIGGRSIKVVYEDFGYADLKRAASAAQKLIDVDKVDFLLTQWNEDTDVAYPIAARRKILMLTFGAGGKDVTHDRDYLFRIWPGYDSAIKDSLRYASQRGIQQMCLIVEQSSFFQSMADVANEEWEKLSGSRPLITEYSDSTFDARALIFEFKDCKAIFLLAGQSRVGPLLKQMKVLHMSPLRLGYDSMEEKVVLETSGEAATDVVFSTFRRFTPQFTEKFRAVYGTNPLHPAATAHDAIKVLAHAAQRGTSDVKEVSKNILALKEFPGASGPITFTKERDRAPIEIVRKKIVDGQPVELSEESTSDK